MTFSPFGEEVDCTPIGMYCNKERSVTEISSAEISVTLIGNKIHMRYETYEQKQARLKKEYEEFIGKTKDIYVVGNYICIVDDYNYDNPKESIVMIYKNNKDYRNGDYLEQVSLSNDNIRKNIKDYIIDTYNVKNYKEYER